VRRCPHCSTENDPRAKFCKQCERYLGWDTDAEPTPDPPEPRVESLTPLLDRKEWGAAFERGAAQIQIRLHNPSEIVDDYVVKMEDPPPWLTISQTDAKVFAGKSDLVVVTFVLEPGIRLPAQTFPVDLRVHSTRDESKYAEGKVTLAIPAFGPPAAISAQPDLVEVVGTDCTTKILLDNRSSNVERFVRLSGSDPDNVAMLRMSPPTLRVPPGETAQAEAAIQLPELADEGGHTWEVTITATNTQDATEGPVEVVVRINQKPPPVLLTLEPAEVRVGGEVGSGLEILIDNRNSTRSRQLKLNASDPDGAMSFRFERDEVDVAAGQQVKLGLSFSAVLPPPGEELRHPFTVTALDGNKTFAVTGAFVQASANSTIQSTKVQITPEVLSVKNATTGLFRVMIQNASDRNWLHLSLQGSDRDQSMQFTFSPDNVQVEPGGVAWGWVRVSAPLPSSGRQEKHEFWVYASDGTDTIASGATFVQNKSSWGRRLMTIGGWILILMGIFCFLAAWNDLLNGWGDDVDIYIGWGCVIGGLGLVVLILRKWIAPKVPR